MARTSYWLTGAILLCSHVVTAQTIGSWTYNTKGAEYFFAGTVNDSGNSFGQYCYLKDATCFYLISLNQTCEAGETYPVLVNTKENGSSHQTLRCGNKVDGKSVLLFDDFDTISATVKGATKIGIAVPLHGDEFIVGRFLLNGADAAIAKMREAAERATATARRTNTKDRRL